MSFAIRIDRAAIHAAVNGLVDDVEAAARPAAQAMAQVFYDSVKTNVARIRRRTGNLERSIYQAFSADNSGQGYATYHVSWNAAKAPHGHLVEYGHLQRYLVTIDDRGRWITHKDKPLPSPVYIPGKPFLRPAMAMEAVAYAAGIATVRMRLGLQPT